jgi:hypothetical protein
MKHTFNTNPKAFVLFHSVDPGVAYYARAVWQNGTLTQVAIFGIDDHERKVARALVIEIPQIYSERGTGRARNARKSDVRNLILSAGRIIDRYENVITVEPREWKGQLDKKTDHARTLAALDEHEKALLTGLTKEALGHIMDAIGIGLKHLWRR